MPRKCTICTHKQLAAISKEISAGTAYRRIAGQFKVGVSSLQRHIENCLKLSLAAIIEQKKEEGGLVVHNEFEQQVALAKKFRAAAEEILLDPENPEKIILIPFADEIRVQYFDHSDLNEHGKPRKKVAPLSNLLHAVQSIGSMVRALLAGEEDALGGYDTPADAMFGKILAIDKISIKHVDLRSFALDAIKTTDITLDKIAKLAGAYQENKENQEKFENTIKAIRSFLEEHPDADRDRVINTFAAGRGFPVDRITAELGVVG